MSANNVSNALTVAPAAASNGEQPPPTGQFNWSKLDGLLDDMKNNQVEQNNKIREATRNVNMIGLRIQHELVPALQRIRSRIATLLHYIKQLLADSQLSDTECKKQLTDLQEQVAFIKSDYETKMANLKNQYDQEKISWQHLLYNLDRATTFANKQIDDAEAVATGIESFFPHDDGERMNGPKKRGANFITRDPTLGSFASQQAEAKSEQQLVLNTYSVLPIELNDEVNEDNFNKPLHEVQNHDGSSILIPFTTKDIVPVQFSGLQTGPEIDVPEPIKEIYEYNFSGPNMNKKFDASEILKESDKLTQNYINQFIPAQNDTLVKATVDEIFQYGEDNNFFLGGNDLLGLVNYEYSLPADLQYMSFATNLHEPDQVTRQRRVLLSYVIYRVNKVTENLFNAQKMQTSNLLSLTDNQFYQIENTGAHDEHTSLITTDAHTDLITTKAHTALIRTAENITRDVRDALVRTGAGLEEYLKILQNLKQEQPVLYDMINERARMLYNNYQSQQLQSSFVEKLTQFFKSLLYFALIQNGKLDDAKQVMAIMFVEDFEDERSKQIANQLQIEFQHDVSNQDIFIFPDMNPTFDFSQSISLVWTQDQAGAAADVCFFYHDVAENPNYLLSKQTAKTAWTKTVKIQNNSIVFGSKKTLFYERNYTKEGFKLIEIVLQNTKTKQLIRFNPQIFIISKDNQLLVIQENFAQTLDKIEKLIEILKRTFVFNEGEGHPNPFGFLPVEHDIKFYQYDNNNLNYAAPSLPPQRRSIQRVLTNIATMAGGGRRRRFLCKTCKRHHKVAAAAATAARANRKSRRHRKMKRHTKRKLRNLYPPYKLINPFSSKIKKTKKQQLVLF